MLMLNLGLIETLPEGPPAQSLVFWMDVIFQLYKDLNIRSPSLLSSLVYPIMLRALNLPITQAAAFKEVVVLHNTKDELEFIVNQDWYISGKQLKLCSKSSFSGMRQFI
jgi:hypothetical protein